MPIYHLTPVVATLEDPVWAASLHRQEVWVNARDEAEARGMASAKLESADVNMEGVSAGPSPWASAAFVAAHELAEGPNGMTIPNGTVVTGRV